MLVVSYAFKDVIVLPSGFKTSHQISLNIWATKIVKCLLLAMSQDR